MLTPENIKNIRSARRSMKGAMNKIDLVWENSAMSKKLDDFIDELTDIMYWEKKNG
tara:strand:+ start:831 stop:998 length:168 start_codon:yes stop_codon:yes gene_type:complete